MPEVLILLLLHLSLMLLLTKKLMLLLLLSHVLHMELLIVISHKSLLMIASSVFHLFIVMKVLDGLCSSRCNSLLMLLMHDALAARWRAGQLEVLLLLLLMAGL